MLPCVPVQPVAVPDPSLQFATSLRRHSPPLAGSIEVPAGFPRNADNGDALKMATAQTLLVSWPNLTYVNMPPRAGGVLALSTGPCPRL